MSADPGPPTTRSVRRSVRWTPGEWSSICQQAAGAGLCPSAYIRARTLAGSFKTPTAPPYRRTGLSERRTIRIYVRWAPSELARVRMRADSLNLPVSRYVREVALGHRLKSRADAMLIHHLNRIGVTVNQLAKVANATKRLGSEDRLREVLARLDQILYELL